MRNELCLFFIFIHKQRSYSNAILFFVKLFFTSHSRKKNKKTKIKKIFKGEKKLFKYSFINYNKLYFLFCDDFFLNVEKKNEKGL